MKDRYILSYGRRKQRGRVRYGRRRNPLRPRRRLKTWVVAVGLAAVLVAVFSYYLMAGKARRMLLRGEQITALLIGTDDTGNSSRADTILLATYSPSRKILNLISIPRDTMVIGPDGAPDKLNHLFSYDSLRLGPSSASLNLLKLVKKNISVDIQFYIHTDYMGFTKLVDAVGGVRVNIDRDMRYVDRAGGLFIDLKKGPQTLDGKGALQYVRYRSDGRGDLGRIDRQHKLLESLAQGLLRPMAIVKLPSIAALMTKNMHTNLSLSDALALLREFRRGHGATIESSILPGAPVVVGGVSYWRTDVSRAKAIVEAALSPHTPSGRSKEAAIKVEVLNGAGVDGVAERMALFLGRRPDLDVVEVGNANHFGYAKTAVVGRRGNQAQARKVAALMGLKADDLFSDFDGRALADVSVIVGRDYKRWVER